MAAWRDTTESQADREEAELAAVRDLIRHLGESPPTISLPRTEDEVLTFDAFPARHDELNWR